jgi:hypothetical protein
MQTAVGRGNAQHINDAQLGDSRKPARAPVAAEANNTAALVFKVHFTLLR